jgi:hypothetical protein
VGLVAYNAGDEPITPGGNREWTGYRVDELVRVGIPDFEDLVALEHETIIYRDHRPTAIRRRYIGGGHNTVDADLP